MTFNDLVRALKKEFELEDREARRFVRSFFAHIVELVDQHGRLELRGFGIFTKVKLKGRFFLVPKSWLEVYKPERATIRFRPTKKARKEVKR